MKEAIDNACSFNKPAANFNLLGVDGTRWDINRCRGAMGMLMIFVSNQCPHVKAVRSRLISEIELLKEMGIGSVAINSSDPSQQPEDAYSFMRTIAEQLNFKFPYLVDDQQAVARAYGAKCTPALFGFNANMELQYHGGLGESKNPEKESKMIVAMREIALTGIGPIAQVPTKGTPIKWASELTLV